MGSIKLFSRSATEKLLVSTWGPIALTFALALILRVAVALWLPREVVWSDGLRYVKVANSLLAGHGFGDLLSNQYSVPSQPLLIAAVWWVAGPNSYLALRLFFAVMGAATCALGYLLGKRLFDPLSALLGALLLCIYPYFIYSSALFEYPQTFFIFVMTLSFILFYDYRQRGGAGRLFVCGICFGAGILSVPTVMLFAPVFAFCLWKGQIRQWIVAATILTVAVCLPVASWATRNYLAHDQFILVNKGVGFNFWIANNDTYYRYGKKAVVPPCASGYEDTSLCSQDKEMENRLGDKYLQKQLSQSEYVEQHEAESWQNGMRFVKETPGEFWGLLVIKFFQLWSPSPDAVNSGKAYGGGARDLIAVASYLPVLILAAVGFFLSRLQWRRLLPVYLYFLTFSVAFSVFLPTTRYRLPLDFFLILFAAYAIIRFIRRADA